MRRFIDKIKKLLLNRRTTVVVLLLMQLAVLFLTIWGASEFSRAFTIAFRLISVIVAVYIVNTRAKPGYKLSWLALILSFPIFGGLFYLLLKLQGSSGKFYRSRAHYDAWKSDNLKQDPDCAAEFSRLYPSRVTQLEYMSGTAGYPLFRNTETVFLTPGEEFFSHFIEELEKAEKFIFLEFFILDDGYMWDKTFEILVRKASEGVDIRLMYDNIGSLFTLPDGFYKTLEPFGIKCATFNEFKPLWSSVQNNRDHRKIMVIDGKVAFTGGVNLADEYINERQRFGYWKDCALMLRGDAIWSFTFTFLQMWNRVHGTEEDVSVYKIPQPVISAADGFVLPYADDPGDDENVSEHVYMQIITQAKKYLYIETPYLIIDDSMMSALILAAKSGVDVRIVTPSIPDKKLVFMTTRSYYLPLIRGGVKIYEYTPGFIHSKAVVSDDEVATVGSPNFDFRSLYLHFECGTVLYGNKTVTDVRDDFFDILKDCHEITEEEMQRHLPVRIFQSILRLLAPFF